MTESKTLMLTMIALCLALFSSQFASGTTQLQSNRKLEIGVTPQPPWSMQDEDGNWTGLSVELWQQVARDLHLDYEYKKCDSTKELQDNLNNGSLDALASGIAITPEREAMFDFSTPYFVNQVSVAVNANQQKGFLDVFRMSLYNWSFLGFVVLVIAFVVVGGVILCMLEHNSDSAYGKTNERALPKAIIWSIIMLSARDLPEESGWRTSPPKTLPGRIFSIIWMGSGILLISLFTACAASILTTKQLQSFVNSPDDLKHVRVGTVNSSSSQAYLDSQHIKYTVYQEPVDLVKALVQNRLDAAVYNGGTLAYYAKNGFSNRITVLNFSMHSNFFAIPVCLNSPLRKQINTALLHVVATHKWKSIVSEFVGSD